MVTLKQHSRFYSRNSAGKYALDVQELRSAFLLSGTLAERMRSFRADRLARIVAGETPVPLNDVARMVLHLFPVSGFAGAGTLDIAAHADRLRTLHPMGASGWDWRYNFDGFMTSAGGKDQPEYRSYLQVFRNQVFEAVNASVLSPREDRRFIPSIAYERYVIEALDSYLLFLRQSDIPTPVFVALSLLGVKGYTMYAGERLNWHYDADQHPIHKDALIFPEVSVDEYGASASQILRPVFDAVWQSCGFKRSLNYGDDGVWREKDGR